MPKLEAVKIDLSDTQVQELEQLLRRASTPQQIALRAKIILRAATGLSNVEIAQELGVSIEMSRRWRQRWQELAVTEVPVLERLKDESRPGSPGTFTMEQITQLYAIACCPPEQYDRPISHWSARELALELVKQGIVTSISERHVGRLLQEADLKPYQSNYWLNPPPTINSSRKSKMFVKSTN
ncbi:helix-turn-helix domain-containing protein [Chamaesiphon polymorphus]|uniref:Transposase n=1 Tax=Chamaesiphon polymorphus CCALA 037 TaxID=2107692 RepID=A0A2T1G201_9CYAN|nr:helix-turn-helix domain-containing protein [Chamaesiphon polymorphus]PSB51200.1 transposase [Chamaesiphon polymorphus CCALA 037]